MIFLKEICVINSVFLFVVDSCFFMMVEFFYLRFEDEEDVFYGNRVKEIFEECELFTG